MPELLDCVQLAVISERQDQSLPNRATLRVAVTDFLNQLAQQSGQLPQGTVVQLDVSGHSTRVAAVVCVPTKGSLVTRSTRWELAAKPIGVLDRARVLITRRPGYDVLDVTSQETISVLKSLQSKERVLYPGWYSRVSELDVLVMSTSPPGVAGLTKTPHTQFKVELDRYGAHEKVHVVPFVDTVGTNSAESLQQLVVDYFACHPTRLFAPGDRFWQEGVQFKVLFVSRRGVEVSCYDDACDKARRRVDHRTSIYTQGAVQVTWLDIVPMQVLRDVRRQPARLQPYYLYSSLDQVDPSEVERVMQTLWPAPNCRGLGKDQIRSFLRGRAPFTGPLDDLNCCICLEDLSCPEEIVELDCGHLLHISCCKRTLSYLNHCPLCRAEVIVN